VFGVGVYGLNLSNPYKKFFDVVLNQVKLGPGLQAGVGSR